MTKSLFDIPKNKDSPSESSRFKIKYRRKPVKRPYSNPDKRGKYKYQKLHDEVLKLPGRLQDFFGFLTTDTATDHLDQFEKCLRMHNRFSAGEQMDWEDSRERET